MPDTPDAPQRSLGWSNAVWQQGFTAIPNVVLRDYKLGPTAFRVYALMLHFSWRQTDDWPDQDGLAELAQCSERALREALRELEASGLIATQRRGLGKTNSYTLIDPSGSADSAVQEPADSAAPSLPLKLVKTTTPSPPMTPPPANRPAKVDRRTVTDAEYALAVAVLNEFNRLAGTRYGSRDYIAKIVMRAREHPALGVADHARVIAHALGDPWWKGPPSPSVVYGNASLFERAVHAAVYDAVHPGERALSAEEVATFGTAWGPNTPFDSLAAAQRAGRATMAPADLDLDPDDVQEADDGA